MNTRMIIILIILFLIIAASEYIIYSSLHHVNIIKSSKLEISLMVLSIVMPILFIVSMLYSYKHYSLFNSLVNTTGAVWLGIILYTFIIALIIFIIIMLNSYLNFNIPIKMIAGILLALMFILISYGIWNANNPRITELNVSSEILSKDWSGKKIVMISDVHLGTIRRENFLRKVIASINQEKPDIVFILGDLIDGSSFPYEKWFKEFASSKPQFGNIYIEGNHEKYSQEYSKFKSALTSTDSLINLTDKKITINNTQIIGLDYYDNPSIESIKQELNVLQYDRSKPSIILVHDPKSVSFLSKEGVSLVLSGHTHGGQFFPFTILVNKIYKKYTHGVTYTNTTPSVTSYGVGTSIIPIRIGTVPEIIVLTIK